MSDNINNISETINYQISSISSLTGDGGGDIHYPYVIFQVFDNKFAVNSKFVVSIENTKNSENINNTDNTEVFNLRELLWGNNCYSEDTKPMEHIIILQIKDKTIGIIVDVAENIEHIDEIQELPRSVITGKYIKKVGLSKTDRKIIYILDPEAFE